MKYEVELKFRLAGSVEQLLTHLEELQANVGSEEAQRDTYFAHPSRDFVATREALRIRSTEAENVITYKGPLIDEQTKTRQEIEIPCESGPEVSKHLWVMWRALGFRDVRRVSKVRRSFELRWEDRDFLVAMDDVEDLGRYVEIETIADEKSWQRARDATLRLAERLGLNESERRSYLEMLLERDPPST
ncbi:MAG: class IV adenylate cyclase [Planctomycetaceae bacterium]|nr:class IV adenylate cyclase [Planctomycetaceae bacterium]